MADSKPKSAITPTRAEDFPEWYQQVVQRRRPRGKLGSSRLHGDQAMGIRHLGKYPGPTGFDDQGDRP